MDMPAYIAPANVDDALEIKREMGTDARVIAGGTDLLLRLRDRNLSPDLLLDLRRTSLDTISSHTGDMHLGAYVTLSQILEHAEIGTLYPALVEACRQFAGPPIRNRGTLGGNIVNASPAADLVPPLMAYDANIVLSSSSGERVLELSAFFTGPGQTILRPDEILTEIRLPLMPSKTTASFIKLGQRRSMAISIVNLCTRITLDTAGVVAVARVVLGSVAPTPLRAFATEVLLRGRQLSSALIDEAAARAREEVSPITDVRASRDYRNRMTQVLVRRALTTNRKDLARDGSND